MKRSPLKRSTALRPRTRLKQRSVRQVRTDSLLDESKVIVKARSGGFCEAGTPACTGRAVHVHHKLMRSQGGNRHLPSLLVDVCGPCHNHIHANPAWSYEQGLLMHSWEKP